MFRSALAAVVVSTVALVGSEAARPWPTSTRTTTVPHVAGKPIEVNTTNGDVEVRIGGTESVRITAKIQAADEARLAKVKVTSVRDADGGLTIGVEWPDGKTVAADGCSFDIRVPDVDGVTVSTKNGGVTVIGCSGPASLETSSGAVTVRGHKGPVTARASNGKIAMNEVTGPVNATTVNGAVDLLEIDGRVRAETRNGGVTVTLVDGAAGPVDIDGSNGAVSLEVGAGFAGELTATTVNGSVKVDAPASVTRKDVKPASARLRFKVSGEPSTIKTTNASVAIRVGAGEGE